MRKLLNIGLAYAKESIAGNKTETEAKILC